MSYICGNCIGEGFLRDLASAEASEENSCEYCDSDLPTVEIWFIAEKCDGVIETFYEPSGWATTPARSGKPAAAQDLQAIIKQLVGVPDRAVDDIIENLSDIWFDPDTAESRYGDDDDLWFVLKTRLDSPISEDWKKMESSLRNEARHLNPNASRIMESVFGRIADDVAKGGTSVLIDVGPGCGIEILFRAREFQSLRKLYDELHHPERFLGAPAAGIAPAGRMNAAGQPAFYGATAAATALAEVRPAVGSYAVIATFAITRRLKLLDLTLLMEVQLSRGTSLFDPLAESAAERRDFLQTLCEKMTLPAMPERQDHNYLITQVVADYLAMHSGASIDGIVYPSVQRSREKVDSDSGRNVVLFHKAATTLHADSIHPTAAVQLWEYDNESSREYWAPVIEFDSSEPQCPFRAPGFNPKPALQLVRDSIRIHRIKSVDIFSDVTSLTPGVIAR